jgi:tripartite-type tricarboxylate transporter receptor subunit TctC
MNRSLNVRMVLLVVMFSIIGLSSQAVEAQDYPTKPILLVNPGGIGGSTDLTMRAVTSVAADYLGQPIIVQVKAGGGGSIGTEFVAKAAPDGYTLLCGGPNWNSTLPAVEGISKGPDDLLAVCRINYTSGILVARSDAPFKTFKEMVEWAKANPGKLVFGHTGPWGGADVSWKIITQKTGIKSRVVPHEGGGPALIAILGGQVQVSGIAGTQGIAHIKSGKLRALAVMAEKRDPDLPDVPTAIEEGVDCAYPNWRAVLAPKGTPRPIIEKLAGAFKKMTENEAVIKMIKGFGDDIQYLGPDDFTKIWRQEFEAYKELAKTFKK